MDLLADVFGKNCNPVRNDKILHINPIYSTCRERINVAQIIPVFEEEENNVEKEIMLLDGFSPSQCYQKRRGFPGVSVKNTQASNDIKTK